MGFDAAGFAFGASSFEAGGYADTLSGKNVYILPNNDEAGRKMVENVAHSLNGIAASVRVLGVEDMQPGWDITDFFEEHGAQVTAKAIILAIDQSVEYQPEDEPRNKNTPDNFFTPACDLKLTAPVWIIEGMLEAETLCQAYGAPEVGKSFFGIDVSACVAAGIPFHGKKVRQGPACYIAGEGQNGLMRRITAWAIRNQVDIKTLPLICFDDPNPPV